MTHQSSKNLFFQRKIHKPVSAPVSGGLSAPTFARCALCGGFEWVVYAQFGGITGLIIPRDVCGNPHEAVVAYAAHQTAGA